MEKKKLSVKQLLPKYNLDIRNIVNYSPMDLFIRVKNSKYAYNIDYNVKLSNGKNLQRDFVWNLEQKRSLILSMIKELQMPNFAVALYRADDDDRTNTFKIVDGKQRLSTIEQFCNNEFGILFENEEYFYDDLDDNARYRVHSYSLNFNIIYEYDDLRLSDEQLISWFELVNFAGTAQDEQHLNYLKS